MANHMVQCGSRLDASFAALSDATRRGVLEQLGRSDASITELAEARARGRRDRCLARVLLRPRGAPGWTSFAGVLSVASVPSSRQTRPLSLWSSTCTHQRSLAGVS